MVRPPGAPRSRRARTRSSYPGKPLLPYLVQLQRRVHVPQTVFGDFAVTPFGHHPLDVQAGHAVAFGGLDAERLAVKIEVELSRRAFAPAHSVKRELLRQIAVRLGRVTIAEPVPARDRHVQLGRAEIQERHVEAPAIER